MSEDNRELKLEYNRKVEYNRGVMLGIIIIVIYHNYNRVRTRTVGC